MKYAITGPAGSGKTKLINELKDKGYAVLEETAREVSFEVDPEARQYEILHQQIKNEITKNWMFTDRGLGDVVGYFKYLGFKPPKVDFHYDKVFYIPHAHPDATYEDRLENNHKEAEALFYDYVYPEYEELVELPNEDRLSFIIKNIIT